VPASNKSVNDGSGGQRNRQQMTDQGRTQQPTIDESGKGEQWLASKRLRGQQLAMVAKGGGGRRRDCLGQREVIAASEAGEVPEYFVLFLEHSKYRTPVFVSIHCTIYVTSQIHDSRVLCA
jgi:hypothetical protein